MKILNLKQIVSISVKDKTFYCNVKKHKGKVYYWKLFGIIPIFPYVAKETTTELRWCSPDLNDNLMVIDDDVYIKPSVNLSFSNEDYECVHFNTYEEALSYFHTVRDTLSDAKWITDFLE